MRVLRGTRKPGATPIPVAAHLEFIAAGWFRADPRHPREGARAPRAGVPFAKPVPGNVSWNLRFRSRCLLRQVIPIHTTARLDDPDAGRYRYIEQVDLVIPPAAQPDIDLLRKIVARDADAFVALYDRYNRLAFGLAVRMLGDPARAEEAVQDAFMQVWKRAASFDTGKGDNVRGWLMTIVHHRAVDLHRRNDQHERKSVSLDDHLDLRAKADTWADVARNLTHEEMRAAMNDLPDDQRRAIDLAYFGGLSQTEIARNEGLPLGTVKGRMRLGLNKLRAALSGLEQERTNNGNQGLG